MKSYKVSFEKMNRLLPEFKPAVDVEADAKELKKLFANINFTQHDFEFPAYTRIKQLRELIQTGMTDPNFYWKAQ